IQWRIALVPVAKTAAARRLATAIIVRDDVVLAVNGIVTGANPRDGGHLGSGRAGIFRSAATAAQITVDGAMPPVIATGRVIDALRLVIGGPGLAGGRFGGLGR